MPRAKEHLTVDELTEIGHATIALAKRVPEYRRAERPLLPMIYGYVSGRYGRVIPEKNVGRGRLDFRFSGMSPTVFEVAVRDPYYQVQAHGSANKTELHKLCREAGASLRGLLIIDLSGEAPIPAENLRASYDRVPGPRGGGARGPVRVIYVHPRSTYHFLWRPWK